MKKKKKIIKKILKFFCFIFLIGIFSLIIFFHKEIVHFIVKKFIYHDYAIEAIDKNEYAKEMDYQFVQITDDFVAKDKKQLINIFYTILDSGDESFYFYCDENYKDCSKDIDELVPDNEQDTNSILSDLNNFVHPYNTYKSINVRSNNFGKILVSIDKQYSHDKIAYINQHLEIIKQDLNVKDLEPKKAIELFHDYIVNYTVYDIERANNINDDKFKNSNTHTAYGLLEEKKALCGGYSDIMSLFLYQIGVPNIRISANNHVWNLVYLDKEWLHIDVTWDDPVTSTGEQLLLHDYRLIPYKKLIQVDTLEHKFDESIYQEAK